jgi:hypothetical protein
MNQIDELIFRFVYNIDAILKSQLEMLRYDLASDDDDARRAAEEKFDKIGDWIFDPLPPLSQKEREQRAIEISQDQSLSPLERLNAARRALSSTGRRRGRPRNDATPHAIRALTMHYATQLSWRHIAFEIRGCKHEHKNKRPGRSCPACGDAIRDAAGRLDLFLKNLGHTVDVPRGNMSKNEV